MANKERTAQIEKHFLLNEDVGLQLEEDIELTVLVSYSFWVDSYGVRGSEFTNGEHTGYMYVCDDEMMKYMEILDSDTLAKIETYIDDKAHNKWMSDGMEAAFNDCYEDEDPRYNR